jgi:hypothetical protein
MKYYNFRLAKKIIEKNASKLVVARMGTLEDWFWTSERVWENGNFITDFRQDDIYGELQQVGYDELVKLGGIAGSDWDTPILILEYKNGKEKSIPVWTNEKPIELAKFEEERKAYKSTLVEKEKETKSESEIKKGGFVYTIGGL